jgi:hypothetical protein
MFSVLLLRAGSSVAYSANLTHIEISSSSTVDVRDAFFQDQLAQHGGAIYFSASSGTLTVTRTTILHCTAIPSLLWGYGGGICHGGDTISISYSCFRETRTDGWSTTVSYYRSDVIANLTDVSFYYCSAINDATGTIDDQDGAISTFIRLNFTDCYMRPNANVNYGDGVAILTRDASASFTCVYCTVLHCTGTTGIDTESNNRPIIEYSNFDDNTFSDGSTSWSLFYVGRSGMTVRYCVCNNKVGRVFLFAPGTVNGGFIVYGCVFSSADNNASSAYYSMSNNLFNAATASHTLTYFYTALCPTESPTRSPSPLSTLTPTPGKSADQPSPSPSTSDSYPKSGTPVASPTG